MGQVNGQIMAAAPGRLRQARGWPPRLLAFLRSADEVAAPSGSQIAADIALAAAATVVSFAMVVLVLTARSPLAAVPPPLDAVPPPLAAALRGMGWQAALPALPGVVARTAPLAIRRFRPLTAFWLCLIACVLANGPGTTVVNFIVVVPAAYAAVVHSRYRGAAMLSMPAALLALPVPPQLPAPSGKYMLLLAQLVFISVLFVGNGLRLWRRRADESRAGLVRLQAEHEAATRQAIGHERARIASELHDVVTHNVSMMVVQAGAARRVLRGSPEDARSALLAIEESGRAAIVELQHLLGLLAPLDGQDGVDPAGAQEAEPPQPQPGLDRIRPLVDRVAAAGLPVELSVRGTPLALAAGLDLAAYRVVQEALTNVIKHASQPPTMVTIDYCPTALIIEVADDGPPGPGSPAGRGTIPGTGRGLLGLRERVSLYGGELEAGARPGGGWLVRARIPVRPPLAAAVAAAACPARS
jgi:signal transduction histidine kinase